MKRKKQPQAEEAPPRLLSGDGRARMNVRRSPTPKLYRFGPPEALAGLLRSNSNIEAPLPRSALEEAPAAGDGGARCTLTRCGRTQTVVRFAVERDVRSRPRVASRLRRPYAISEART